MKISGQLDRTIQPGKSEQVEVTISVGQATGKFQNLLPGSGNPLRHQHSQEIKGFFQEGHTWLADELG